MARFSLFPMRSGHPETVSLMGSFAPNGAGAVDQSSIEGPIGSVTRSGVGVFDIVFADSHPGLLAAAATLQLNALADSDVQFGAYDAANKKITVRVKTAGVAADIAANANNRIHLVFHFRDTTLTVKK
jgi:hypothetical protein